MTNKLQEIKSQSQVLKPNVSFEIEFLVPNPGRISVSVRAPITRPRRVTGLRRTPEEQPTPDTPANIKHKTELFQPGLSAPVASGNFTGFTGQELTYHVPEQAAGLSQKWRAVLTNKDTSSQEFVLEVQYVDEIYDYWLGHKSELSELGDPITDAGRVSVADGAAVFFLRGCLWKGPASSGQYVRCAMLPPLLGQTMFLNTASAPQREFFLLRWRTSSEMRDTIRRTQPHFFTDVWAGKIALQSVGESAEYSLQMNARDLQTGLVDVIMVVPEWYEVKRKVTGRGATPGRVTIETVRIPLPERTLYNLSLHLPNITLVVAPHIVYTKQSWENFGFIHATDLHLSRRMDTIRSKLRQANKLEGVKEYNNYNDAFRELIKYANHLHSIGMLDFLLLTGDIVDFDFDSYNQYEHTPAVGNWAFFEELICGRAPSSDVNNEELRVPFFLTLGNHDYRINPHELIFDIDLQWPLPNQYGVPIYSDMNLTKDEAIAVQEGKVPWLSQEAGLKTLAIDSENQRHSYDYFYQHIMNIGYASSYVVRLGAHRLVMLDTKWDLGIPDGFWDALGTWLAGGESREDMMQAKTGSPNSKGLETDDLGLVKTAIEEAGSQGLVIIGMHAPPFNSVGAATHSHYFRETEHPTANPAEITEFLLRHITPVNLEHTTETMLQIQAMVKEWPPNGTAYFKRGSIEMLMDHGIAKEGAENFMKLCLGIGISRKADVVFYGHSHDRAEFRLGWDTGANQFLYYTDFYTENPPVYYRSRKSGFNQPVAIKVKASATPNGQVTKVRDHRAGAFWTEDLVLDVPPYATPLNSTPLSDVGNWWEHHRPLLLQTASIGPTDFNQRKNREINPTPPNPTFQGFRLISVNNNKISRIRYATLNELRANNYRMPWENLVVTPVRPINS